jgi:hypothetical protein
VWNRNNGYVGVGVRFIMVRGGHAESGRLWVPETWFNLSEFG